MISSGDFAHWAIVKKTDIFDKSYTNDALAIQLSSISCFPYGARAYLRGGFPEDPWISVKNHDDPSGNIMVYGGNSVSYHNSILQTSGGMDVYIRNIPGCPRRNVLGLIGGKMAIKICCVDHN